VTIEAAPLLHPKQGWLTYEAFYGLTGKAFSLSSDPSFYYNSGSHAVAFRELLSGIRRRESLSMLSGEIGTGKTTLCRTVLKNLDQQTFSAFVSDPFTTREDLLKIVLVEFGVVSASDLATGRLRGATRTELSYLLYEFLGTLSPLQAFAVVFIDEAQNLSVPLLEEIRILSDSDGRERQLQVVLVGQPELRDKLRRPEMRQVAQRISVRCLLTPLTRDGVEGYVAHRLHVAGGAPDRVRLSREAIDVVFEASAGIPRVLNGLCDRALHHGHVRRQAVIDGAVAVRACTDMEVTPPRAAPAPSTDASAPAADRTDAWFSEIDACVQRAAENEPMQPSDLTAPPTERPMFSMYPGRRFRVPATRMERLRRRWVRRMAIAVVLLFILGGAGLLGETVASKVFMPPASLPQVTAPQPPPLPATLVVPTVPGDDTIAGDRAETLLPF
jgi:type II secretory pathway predicted ATPase ExeA